VYDTSAIRGALSGSSEAMLRTLPDLGIELTPAELAGLPVADA